MTDRATNRTLPRLLLAGVAGLLAAALPPAATVHAAAASATIEDGGTNGCVLGAGGQGSQYCYLPEVLTIGSGDTVTWTNHSDVGHNVTRCDSSACAAVGAGSGSDSAFTPSATLGTGATFAKAFTGAGTYNYYCSIHGYAAMHGSVVVPAAATPQPTATTPTPTPTPSTGSSAATATPSPAVVGLPKTGGAPVVPAEGAGSTSRWVAIAVAALLLALTATLARRRIRRRGQTLS
jgi:plastocyanin